MNLQLILKLEKNHQKTSHNVNTTLYQRCFNVASVLVRTISSPVGLLMIMDL